jgi:heme-degrading monooxygenase HmoA
MVVITFRSRLADGHDAEYEVTAQRMIDLASAMSGFISFKTFANADGERVSIIEFESEETAAAWRNHPEHRRAQRRGREAFYESYSIQVCTEVRSYGFAR